MNKVVLKVNVRTTLGLTFQAGHVFRVLYVEAARPHRLVLVDSDKQRLKVSARKVRRA